MGEAKEYYLMMRLRKWKEQQVELENVVSSTLTCVKGLKPDCPGEIGYVPVFENYEDACVYADGADVIMIRISN